MENLISVRQLGLGQIVSCPDILTVNFDETLEVMIASGRYDWTNGDINSKCFPIKGKGIVQYERKLFHFNRAISSQDVIKMIETDDKANPWEPGKIEHLLSSGKQNPEEQRKFPIFALGSVAEVYDRRSVSCLDKDGSFRHLYLFWFDGVWGAGCRFLAVRKLVS